MKLVLVGESFGRHESIHSHPLVWWSGYELGRMLAEAELGPPPPRWPAGADPNSASARNFSAKMIAYWTQLRKDHSIAVTNVFNEHPTDDKTELFFDNVGEPDLPPIRVKQRVLRLRPAYRHHIEKLWKELVDLHPNVVVALGNFACWALLGRTGITAVRGTTQWCEKLDLKCIATFHPAALRDEKLRPTIVADLRKAKR
jgi:hypothetical protein